MNQYNEISTLQYMGSKTRIISHICEPIIKNKSIKTVVDLFAGAGSVGYALKSHKNIISNDLEYYAYIINHAILNGCDFSVTDEISFWNAVEQQSASLQAKVCTAVTTENKFFIDTVDYKQYQLFCEKTPSVFMPQSDDPRLKEILDLGQHRINGRIHIGGHAFCENQQDAPCFCSQGRTDSSCQAGPVSQNQIR